MAPQHAAAEMPSCVQALRGLLQEQGDECVAAVLPQWAHVFPRLVLDNDRSVRQEAADVMRLLAQVWRWPLKADIALSAAVLSLVEMLLGAQLMWPACL